MLESLHNLMITVLPIRMVKSLFSRELLGAFLLWCLAFPLLGTYFSLQYHKFQIKHTIKEQVIAQADNDELVLLKFTSAESQTDLRWEHSREFEYQGQMYDVVRTSTQNDTIYYWCWWDQEETRLNQQLNALLADVLEQDEEKKKQHKHLISFYHSLFCSEISQWQACVFMAKKLPMSFYSLSYSPPFNIPPLPPPRVS